MHFFSFSFFLFLEKTVEIDSLRFQDKDVDVIGTLEYGQFGVVSFFVLAVIFVGIDDDLD